MSLRLQLLAFGLLTLALPWAGLRFVEQMEAALRVGLESSLLASAGTVATALANRGEIVRSDSGGAGVIYGHQLTAPPRIDGFGDDWELGRARGPLPADAAVALDAASRFWSGVSGRFAYLLFDVEDQDLVYESSPGATPVGDRIVLLLGQDAPAGPPGAEGAAGVRALLLATAAPGQFRARESTSVRFVPDGPYEDRVLAAWRETSGGFSVEVRVPLSLIGGRLGVGLIDVDRGAAGYDVRLLPTWTGSVPDPRSYVFENDALRAVLAELSRRGDRYRVLGPDGWVLADTGSLEALDTTVGASLSERFFRYVLRRDDPEYDGLENPLGRLGDPGLRNALSTGSATAWFRQGPARSAVVAAAVPIEVTDGIAGAVLLEQASDSVLTLTNQALMRLMSFTVLVSIAAAAGLLAYATFLSYRVRRLARATESALGPHGEISVAVPGSRARDELGDLSRSFESLLGRLRSYTEYLRTLTGKLAHEIRTPVAIVSTSIDNLEHEVGHDSARTYLTRLRQGSARLEAILSSMSAATRVEQAVAESPAETFDLVAVVDACASAYRDVYPERRFDCDLPDEPCMLTGSPDLLAQLMDKLVENAVGFSEAGSTIRIRLTVSAGEYELSVTNRGPALPASMRHQLFDSLVSVRESADGGAHLGLGLYIVGLVARYHAGRVIAEDLADGSGVVVRIRFPRRRAGRQAS